MISQSTSTMTTAMSNWYQRSASDKMNAGSSTSQKRKESFYPASLFRCWWKRGSSEYLFHGPPEGNPLSESAMADTGKPGPLAQIQSLSVECVERVFLKWFRQRSFNGPTILQSLEDGSSSEPEHASPFGNSHAATLERQEPIRAFVVHVFLNSSPANIVWCIWSVVIDAIDLMNRRWAGSHVATKTNIAVSPLFADRDAPSAIPSKRFIRWPMAAIDHVHPSAEKVSTGHRVIILSPCFEHRRQF